MSKKIVIDSSYDFEELDKIVLSLDDCESYEIDLEILNQNPELYYALWKQYYEKYGTYLWLDRSFFPQSKPSGEIAVMLMEMKLGNFIWNESIPKFQMLKKILLSLNKWKKEASEFCKFGETKIDLYESMSLPKSLLYISGRPKITGKNLQSQKGPLPLMNYTNLSHENQIFLKEGKPFEMTDRLTLKKSYFIGVSRYASESGIGYYYAEDKTNQTFCGTFYYIEPNSNIILNIGKPNNWILFQTKVAASLFFLEFYPKESVELQDPLNEVISNILAHFFNTDPSVLKSDVVYTDENNNVLPEIIQDIYNYYTDFKTNYFYLKPNYINATNNTFYREFYVLEDLLDQALCNIASSLDIFVLMFTNTAGNYRSIGEVLDTRNRNSSYSSLIRLIE